MSAVKHDEETSAAEADRFRKPAWGNKPLFPLVWRLNVYLKGLGVLMENPSSSKNYFRSVFCNDDGSENMCSTRQNEVRTG